MCNFIMLHYFYYIYSKYQTLMKSTLQITFFIFIFSFNASSQECGGMFYDNGGSNGQYTNNQNEITTICPDNAGDVLTVIFDSFETENCCDYLQIHDGSSTSSPLIGQYKGINSPGMISADIANGGCLTFHFISDSSITRSGWAARIFCSPPVTCSMPVDLAVNEASITIDEAEVSWVDTNTDTGEPTSGWDIEYGPVGFQLGTGLIVNASASPFTLTGLDASTDYCFYVRAACGNFSGEEDSFSQGSVCFTTLCDAVSTPFYENFNNGILSNCWEQGVNNNENWLFDNDIFNPGHIGNNGDVNGTITQSGGYFMYVDDSAPNNLDTALISPFIDLTGNVNPVLSFYYISHHEFLFQSVNFSIDIWNGTSWDEEVFTSSTNTNGWEQTFVDLSAYAGQTIQLKFIVDELSGSIFDDFAIDDVFVGEMPTCLAVNSITVDSISDENMFLSWADNNMPAATNWQIVYGESGFDVASATPINTNMNSGFEINGLAAITDYDVYIRSNCGGGDYSFWNGPLHIKTACPIFVAPYVEDFEDGGLLDECWSQNSSVDAWQFSNNVSIPYNIGNNGDLSGTTTESNGYFAYIDNGYPSAVNNAITTPYIDISNLSTPTLYFYYISDNQGYNNVNFSVDVWDGTNWNVDFFTSNTNTSGWEHVILSLENLNITGLVQVRFIVDEISGSFQDDLAIDDVSIDEEYCWSITDLYSYNETTNSLNLGWTDNNNTLATTNFVVEYGQSGFVLGNGTQINVNSGDLSVLVTGLDSLTDYDFYIISQCAFNDNVSELLQVTTLTSCYSVVNLAVTNITETSATITWNDNPNNSPAVTSWNVMVFDNGVRIVNQVVHSNTFELTGLVPSPISDYEVSVSSNCIVDGSSAVESVDFSTSIPAVVNSPYNVGRTPFNLHTNRGNIISTGSINVDDRFGQVINLGFKFNYFNFKYNKVIMGDNGIISFDINNSYGFCNYLVDENVLIPNVNIEGNSILGVFQDFQNLSGGSMSFETYGVAPFRNFLAIYDNVQLNDCITTRNSNLILLHETYNIIDVQIEDKNICSDFWNDGRAILGIQSIGGQYGYAPDYRNNGVWEAHNEGYRFMPEYDLPDFQYIICDADETALFNLNTIYTHFDEGNGNNYSSFRSFEDANNNSNAIAGINYINETNSQSIFVRELIPNGDVNIKRVLLAAIDCNADYDFDTIATADEDLNGNGNYGDDDTDGDAIPDFIDEDDDGDYVLTNVEAVVTTINRGNQNVTNYLDTDGDQIPDYLDNDDDGDGVSTLNEDYDGDFNPVNDDTNTNGVPDYLDSTVALGTDNYLLNKFVVYPNPVNNKVNIQFNDYQKDVSIKIYNMHGQKVYVKNNVNDTLQVDVANLSNGVYFINIANDDKTIVKKFIKK